jgi:hypothetical protein
MSPKLQKRLLSIAFDLRDCCEAENRHISFLLDKNRIVSVGFNSNYKYSKITRGMGYWASSRHSEIDSYIKLRDKNLMPYLSLVNIRLSKTGTIGMACPCDKCLNFLSIVSPRRIFYTTADGSFARY